MFWWTHLKILPDYRFPLSFISFSFLTTTRYALLECFKGTVITWNNCQQKNLQNIKQWRAVDSIQNCEKQASE